MIKQISTKYFKRFETQEFPLEPLTLLAGPNNSGKSTLLQAAMVWNLAMQKWWEKIRATEQVEGEGSNRSSDHAPGIYRSAFAVNGSALDRHAHMETAETNRPGCLWLSPAETSLCGRPIYHVPVLERHPERQRTICASNCRLRSFMPLWKPARFFGRNLRAKLSCRSCWYAPTLRLQRATTS